MSAPGGAQRSGGKPSAGAEGGTEAADLLVRDALLVATMDAGREIPGGWVAIRDGRVLAVGEPGTELQAREQLSAKGCLVTPGLVNTHHHIFQNLTRAFGPVVNAPFGVWWETLRDIWVRLDAEAVFVSTWVGLAELALGGCTATTDDLFIHPTGGLIDAEIEAAREVGMRFHPVRGSADMTEPEGGVLPDDVLEDLDTILADGERLVNRYHERSADAMVQVALSTTGFWGSTLELFRDTSELAERLDVRLHTHMEEGPWEAPFTQERYGRRSMDLLEEVGWASERSWLAHCVFLNGREVSQLGACGTGVSHCPSSNMLFCSGMAPVAELRAAGSPVGLGCDGSATTDHASLWLEARTALMTGKLRGGPGAMGARDVLEIATRGSAACLGRQGELGVLAPGACGDLVAWPLEGPAFAGALSDPVEAWLRCGPNAARHTVVAGRPLVRDGELTLPGLDERLRQHERIARSWQAAGD